MLELKNVKKQFGETVAVDNVSFLVKPGEIVGFLGPNGAGKTTTMRMISTLLEPDEGNILFEGNNIHKNSLAIRSRLGFMPENNPLYDDMLVFEYLEYVASINMKGENSSSRKKAIEKVVEETEIQEVYFRQIDNLSKGYKQRVGLAATMVHTPDLLILDEPTEGLDPNQRLGIRDLIKNLGGKRTVILSTHVMQEVAATCDRVIIINKGKVVADSSVAELIIKTKGSRIITLEAEGLKNTASLEAVKGVGKITHKEDKDGHVLLELTASEKMDPRGAIFDLAKKDHWRIWELHQKETTLEEVFRELTVE